MPKQATQTTVSRITLAAPDASEVFVAGSFNEWSTTTHAMTRDRQGWWEIELDLPPSRYEYK
ncbi:MAG TPA: glycoside hydrolase family 13, partial [Phycisphaerales bacterium]|nr:glycoside hydrolase family 13 [Phycisphaerales bacterium]